MGSGVGKAPGEGQIQGLYTYGSRGYITVTSAFGRAWCDLGVKLGGLKSGTREEMSKQLDNAEKIADVVSRRISLGKLLGHTKAGEEVRDLRAVAEDKIDELMLEKTSTGVLEEKEWKAYAKNLVEESKGNEKWNFGDEFTTQDRKLSPDILCDVMNFVADAKEVDKSDRMSLTEKEVELSRQKLQKAALAAGPNEASPHLKRARELAERSIRSLERPRKPLTNVEKVEYQKAWVACRAVFIAKNQGYQDRLMENGILADEMRKGRKLEGDIGGLCLRMFLSSKLGKELGEPAPPEVTVTPTPLARLLEKRLKKEVEFLDLLPESCRGAMELPGVKDKPLARHAATLAVFLESNPLNVIIRPDVDSAVEEMAKIINRASVEEKAAIKGALETILKKGANEEYKSYVKEIRGQLGLTSPTQTT